MANRDLSNFREVTRVQPELEGQGLIMAGELGSKIVDMSQKAKVAENLSAAQLELAKLDNDFRIKNEANPFDKKAIEAHKTQRSATLGKYRSDIGSIWASDFDTQADNLIGNSDLQMQNWGYKQAEVNTVMSIDNMAQNQFALLEQQAEAYGATGEGDLDILLDFQASENALRKVGVESGVVGETKLNQTLESFRGEAVQRFMGKLATTNPREALRLLDNPKIQDAGMKSKNWGDFTTAIQQQALNFQKVAIAQEITTAIKGNSNAFVNSKSMTFNEYQQVTEGMSEPAKKYFATISGFGGKASEGESVNIKLNESQKLAVKESLFSKVGNIMGAESTTLEDAQVVQNEIFDALNKKAISDSDAQNLMTNLLEPIGDSKINDLKDLEDYDNSSWFGEDVGFSQIQDFYENSKQSITEDDTPTVTNMKKFNNVNARAALYSGYLQNLQISARKNNLPNVAAIKELPGDKQKEIYKEAATNTKNYYRESSAPLGLSGVVDMTDISELVKDPSPQKQQLFDSVYGMGAANRILNRGK